MAFSYSGQEGDPNETHELHELHELHEFHKSRNTDIEVIFLYVGGKTVESVHKTVQPLDEAAVFQKRDVANMVRSRQYLNKTKYKLISLLRYSINLEPEEVQGVVYTDTRAHAPSFLHIERHIADIHFEDNVNVFQHTNAVFFVFSRDHSKRKKGNETKRIIFNDRLRKTKREWKKLKDTRNL